jgi:hypothetical protein
MASQDRVKENKKMLIPSLMHVFPRVRSLQIEKITFFQTEKISLKEVSRGFEMGLSGNGA